MTANELSGWLISFAKTEVDYEEEMILKTSIMLRQQQAKIESLQEHNANLIDDLFSERKEVIKLEAEIEQLKALAISLSHRNANIQYTRSEK